MFKKSFSPLASSKMDRFASDQDLNDHWPILHISSNTFHQRKCSVFVIFVCMFVCHIPKISFVHSILERGRNFVYFGGWGVPITLVNGSVIL